MQFLTKHFHCLVCAACPLSCTQLLLSSGTVEKVANQVLQPGYGCFAVHSWNSSLFFGEAVLHLALRFSDTGSDSLLSDSEFGLLGNLAARVCCLKVMEVGIR